MTHSNLALPPRQLTVKNVYVELKVTYVEHIHKVKPNSLLMDQYPNMVVMPVIHVTSRWTDTIVPFVVISLSTESILLFKCEDLGF